MRIDLLESFPHIWLLHIGVFVVFLPAIAVQGMLPHNDNDKAERFQFAPKWMQFLTKAAFVYALVNFVVFIFLVRSGNPYKENGAYVLRNHGKLIRQITEQEYHQYRMYIVRG